MWHNLYPSYGIGGFGVFGLGGGIFIALLVIWSIIWKGLALWKSAREGSRIWFVVFLVINTLGILEILYLYIFSNKSQAKARESKETK